MKTLLNEWRSYENNVLKEQVKDIDEGVAEFIPGTSAHKMKKSVEKSAEDNFPSKPPKKVKIAAGSNLAAEVIINTWKQLAYGKDGRRRPGLSNDPDKILAGIGGPKQLVANVKALEANFAGSAENPARIEMPVVDPKKDMNDLKGRLAKGELDVKPPFAPPPPPFPKDLAQASDEEQAAFLTKGLRDKNPTDDAGVSLSEQPIDVKDSYPTQSAVYLDKSMWNILSFGPTERGGVIAFKGIAIQDGGKNYILDGHHRWSSAWISGGDSAKMKVQVLTGLDIPTAIAALRSYGNARDNAQKA